MTYICHNPFIEKLEERSWRRGEVGRTMKKLMVYLDEEMHEELREIAFRKRTTMAALVRHAIEETFEDEMDIIAAERSLQEAIDDPNSSISWEDYKKQRRLDVRAAG
jgi:predicted DNA-binding protein